ncbi:MAG TPA: amidohydrolase family protein [Acidimicrobiia bacterium]|nr:amidohydrolase family protein [Acidimicrobiia bacterium]
MAPALDLLIRDGLVVDGTGATARRADVAVRDGRVVSVEDGIHTSASRVVEADGRIVTPGFVDVHTHYDAQLHWDPTASPASWHGVTTLLTGNCGFTIAPSKPADLQWLLLMLSRVEGMSADALAAGVDFPGGTLGDFLGNLDGRVGVNVGANVGHCALRRHVLGDDASEREATDDEVAVMQDLLRQALTDGAVGFTSSQLAIHVAHDGRGVPSNYAAPDELIALASVLGEFGRGSIEFIPRTFLEGYDNADRDLIRRMAEVSGRPVHLNTLTMMPHAPEGWHRSLEFSEAAARDGLAIHPMFASNRQGAHFQLGTTFLFDEMPSFRDTLTLPAANRDTRLRDPALRDQMRREIADPTGRAFVFVWQVLRVETVVHDRNRRWLDRSVTEIAAELGVDPLDAFLDLSLDENLETQFVLAAPPDQKRLAATETMIRAPFVMAGSSDGGAHLLSFCGADYTTRLLTEWVPDVLTLEAAVARLTSIPARAVGLTDRGVLAPGRPADVLVIDPERLSTPDAPRYVEDFPAGSGRFVTDADGYDAVIVNGEILLDGGTWTGATPGTIVRGGAVP